jgi:outer membrane protein TolC
MNKLLCGLILWILTAGTSLAHAEVLSLSDCLQLARQQNLALQAEAINLPLAAEKVRETRSNYLPQVDLSGGYTAQAKPQQVLLEGRAAPTQDQDYPHLSLTAEQLLYDFGRTDARVTALQAQAEAAGAELAGSLQDLLLSTSQAYFQVLAAQALLLSAKEEVVQVEEHRRVAQALYEEGVVTRNDLLQAEVRLASSRQGQYVREGTLDNAWLDLNYLTGRPADTRAELQAQRPDEEPPEFDAATLNQRPGLIAQQRRIVAAEAAIDVSRSEYRPELFARLGADYIDNSYVKEQTIYRATLGLRVNLFDGYATTSKLSQAALVLNQEQSRLRDLQARTELEYRQAGNAARVARQRISVAEKTIRQAEENLRINQNRYREQIGTASEVLDAQTLLTQSRTDLALAVFDYQVAVTRVQHAAGKL